MSPFCCVHLLVRFPSESQSDQDVHCASSSDELSASLSSLFVPSLPALLVPLSPSLVLGAGLGGGVGTAVAVPVGAVTALASNVTAVCASALPFKVAPVFMAMAVWDNIIPLKFEVVPSVA